MVYVLQERIQQMPSQTLPSLQREKPRQASESSDDEQRKRFLQWLFGYKIFEALHIFWIIMIHLFSFDTSSAGSAAYDVADPLDDHAKSSDVAKWTILRITVAGRLASTATKFTALSNCRRTSWNARTFLGIEQQCERWRSDTRADRHGCEVGRSRFGQLRRLRSRRSRLHALGQQKHAHTYAQLCSGRCQIQSVSRITISITHSFWKQWCHLSNTCLC